MLGKEKRNIGIRSVRPKVIRMEVFHSAMKGESFKPD